jgi:hypothetical protein
MPAGINGWYEDTMNDFFPFFPFFFIPTRFVPGDECGFQHSTQYGTAQLSSAQHAACISAAASHPTADRRKLSAFPPAQTASRVRAARFPDFFFFA